VSAAPGPRESVIVTGGASGIGLACAVQAAERGARVAILDASADAAAAAVAGLPGDGHAASLADVTDAGQLRARIDDFAAAGDGITGVIAAAGIVSRSALAEITPEEFRRVLAVNVEGVQNTVSAALPHLVPHGARAAIVVLGSVAAFTGGGLMGNGAYATSKAAVIGLVRAYARELAPLRIRANLVAPAATNTPMTQTLDPTDRARIEAGILLGRFAEADEIAATVSFLLSAGAGAITGQVVHANGGVYFG
jgi:3-oxoacyl-[acyl-carrier protein] reductase